MAKIVCTYSPTLANPSFKGRKSLPFLPSPKIAVVDFFNTRTIDVNGDDIADFSHGKFCSAVIKSILPSAKVSNFRLAGQKGHCDDEKMSSVVEQFHKISEKI